ncbi:MAG: hypothetical protein ACRD22_00145 [Terriglobia bacterium]
MVHALAERWFAKFMETVRGHEAAALLRDAAIKAQLGEWTRTLTSVVVATCEAMEWRSAAKGYQSRLLPVSRQEYLGLDVIAFEAIGDRRWRFPVAVFELENSAEDDRVAYSLWKVLCIRTQLRVVFCYRQDGAEGSNLVRHLSAEAKQAMELSERAALGGETLVVVGSRDESKTFPYGFFKDWIYDTNVGRFGRA